MEEGAEVELKRPQRKLQDMQADITGWRSEDMRLLIL